MAGTFSLCSAALLLIIMFLHGMQCVHAETDFDVEDQVFTITASPQGLDGNLCPENTTFQCIMYNISSLSNFLIWWYDNGNEDLDAAYTGLFPVGAVELYPWISTVNNATVIVENGTLIATRRYYVDTSLSIYSQLLRQRGTRAVICQLGAGETSFLNSRRFNITGYDMRAPTITLQSLSAIYNTDGGVQVAANLSTQVYSGGSCTYQANTIVTVILLQDDLVVYSDTSDLCDESVCSYYMQTESQQGLFTVSITLSNSLLLSSESNFTVPSSRLSFDLNGHTCTLTVMCLDRAVQNVLSDCQIFRATDSTFSDQVLLANGRSVVDVQPNTVYYFQSTWNLTIRQQIYNMTETCGNSGVISKGSIAGIVITFILVLLF